jgi:hypothetical protein
MLIFKNFHCSYLIIFLKPFLFHLYTHCCLGFFYILFKIIGFWNDGFMLKIVLLKFTFKIFNQSMINQWFFLLHLLKQLLPLVYNLWLESQLCSNINFTIFWWPYCDINLVWKFDICAELFTFLSLWFSWLFNFFLHTEPKSFALNT